MNTQTHQVLERAIVLPPIERAELLEGILSSFDFPARADIDAAWAQEAEDRIDAFNRGDILSISATEVFEKINKKFVL
jgi:putative addiction module component (TIGR02574 family)